MRPVPAQAPSPPPASLHPPSSPQDEAGRKCERHGPGRLRLGPDEAGERVLSFGWDALGGTLGQPQGGPRCSTVREPAVEAVVAFVRGA